MAINPSDNDRRNSCYAAGGIFRGGLGSSDQFDPNSEVCQKKQLDCKLVKRLEEADTAGNNDGCVTLEDVQARYTALTKADSERILLGLRFRAQHFYDDYRSTYDSIFLEQKINVLEALVHIADEGYLVRDRTMAQSGIPTLLSLPGKLFGARAFTGLMEELGSSRSVLRKEAIDLFVGQLRKYSAITSGSSVVTGALNEVAYSSSHNEVAMCRDSLGGLIFDCGDVILSEDLPLDIIARFLDVENGDSKELVRTIYQMGAWFQERNNWVAARYIFEQLIDNGDKPELQDIVADATRRVDEMRGATTDNVYFEGIIPPTPWGYADLSIEGKYTYLSDWGGFVGAWASASKVVEGTLSAAGLAWGYALSECGWLAKLVAANAKFAPKAATVAAAGTATAGAEVAGKDVAAGAATTGAATAAAAGVTMVGYPVASGFAQSLAKILDTTGKFLYQPFGLIRSGSFYVAAGARFAGKVVGDVTVWASESPNLLVSLPAKAAIGGFNIGKEVLVGSARLIKFLGRGTNAFGGYMLVRAYGNPFVPYPIEEGRDITSAPLNRALSGYEIDWAIQMAMKEVGRQPMTSADAIMIMKLDRAEWEGTRRAKKRCDLGSANAPESCRINVGPQASLDNIFEEQMADVASANGNGGSIVDILTDDPLLRNVEIGFFERDGLKIYKDGKMNELAYSAQYQVDMSIGPDLDASPIGGGSYVAGYDLSVEHLFAGAQTTVTSADPFAGNVKFGGEGLPVDIGQIGASYNIYQVEMHDGSSYAVLVPEKFDAKMKAVVGEDYFVGAFNI